MLPKIACPQCKEEFSTQWADSDEDRALSRGPVISERFELGRNFCNKLWNASRFVMLNMTDYESGPVSDDQLEVEDRWILSRLTQATQEATEALQSYRYGEAARVLYDFAWDEFCSFYVEIVKKRLQDEHQHVVAQRVMAHVLDTLLRLLHPIIPFITEDIWQLLAKAAPQRGLPEPQPAAESIMIADWPQTHPQHRDENIEDRFAKFQTALSAVNEIRSRQNIAPRNHIEFFIRCDGKTVSLLEPMRAYFESMANAAAVNWGPDIEPPPMNSMSALPGMDVFVDVKDFIDVEAEIQRNEKQIEKLEGLIRGKEKKLSNEKFIAKAPPQVVQQERDSLAQVQEQLTSIRAALEELRKSAAK